MPKRKTTQETEVSAAPATESTANAPRKRAAKPKAATTTAAPHKHVHKSTKSVEVTIETPLAETVAAAPAIAPKSARVVTHEDIARLAYSYWEARGYQGGSPHEDWLRAESELAQIA